MQMTADAPQEFLAAAKQPELGFGEQPSRDELRGIAHAIDVFSDPKQRIEIAQAALALFYVGLDKVARRSGPRYPGLAFGQFGGDELPRRPAHNGLVKARPHCFKEVSIAENQ